jgi:hypothetical protein
MPQYRAKLRAFFGGRIREPGDVVEMDCTPDQAGHAWEPAEGPSSVSGPAQSVDQLFGPPVPKTPRPRAAKLADPKPAS